MKSSEAQLHALVTHLLSVEEEERSRIGRAIYDELGKALTALKIDLAWVAKRVPSHLEALQKKIQTMSNMIDETVGVVRRISAELRPSVLDDLGLVAALEWLVGDFQRRTNVACVFTKNREDIVVDAAVATPVFRICQDALTNVTRRANTTRIEVKLIQERTDLFLEVRTNGRGIPDQAPADRKSLGLMGMRERVMPWGGNVHIRRGPGTGSVVTVHIPLGEHKVSLPWGIW